MKQYQKDRKQESKVSDVKQTLKVAGLTKTLLGLVCDEPKQAFFGQAVPLIHKIEACDAPKQTVQKERDVDPELTPENRHQQQVTTRVSP